MINGDYLAIEKPLLYLHILAGFISLAIAYVLLFIKKGNKRHKKLGMIYVYGMTTIFVTAIPLSLLGEFNPFLFVIAIFSFYLAFSGYRQGRDRNGAREQIDKVLGVFITATSILFYSMAVSLYLIEDSMWITSVVFGSIALGMGINDFRRMKIDERPDFYDRTNLHLNLMLAGTIATTTAFIVTLNPFSIDWLNWVAPTIVGTPIIIYFSRRELAKKAT
ncbi:MAG: hypothetical protein P8H47_03815 [Candidatus Actinomarina sp.]|nr:hypothetical protein [Candidatus Actinomarina sp.]|tara:strand:- start:359 stop:1018 length:660 start_codon:yes stop_codon:yes gene_type:complete